MISRRVLVVGLIIGMAALSAKPVLADGTRMDEGSEDVLERRMFRWNRNGALSL
jgi:hypothetical protein